MSDLTAQLEASLTGRVATRVHLDPALRLPSESECHQVHAMLARGIREQRRFRTIEITDEPITSPSNDCK
jgi:hypothetical protein